MKKILLLGPPPGTQGGVTIWMKIVLDYLRSNSDKNLNVIHLPITRSVFLTHLLPFYKRLYYSIKDYAKGVWGMTKAYHKQKFDKVHIVSSAGEGIIRDWFYTCVSRLHNVKPIVHFHCGTLPKVLENGGLLKWFLQSTIRMAYKVILLDEESYVAVKNAGYNNVLKIGNSFNSIIEDLESSSTERVKNEILFVGHVVREKGIFEFLEAVSGIENINVKIFGPQNEELQQEIEKYLSEAKVKGNIQFMGLQPSIEVYKAMRRANLFVLPTYSEGFPYVVVEAMASGCPIISTPVGAIEEMLTYNNEVQGFLVEPKNADSLRTKILYCLENDEDIHKKAINAKKKAYSEYSTEAIMNKFINLWKE